VRAFGSGIVGLALSLAAAVPAAAIDPVRDAQWYLDTLRIDQVHDITKGRGITVAVIDTGVDASHPDLAGQILAGADFTAAASGDGRVDESGHGTGMAGIIAAHGRAEGIAPDARILPVRVAAFDKGFRPTDKGIEWAITHGATVLCIPAGGEDTPEVEAAIAHALDADVVVVAAAGNRPEADRVDYPAAIPGVVAAAGVGRDGEHAEISVTGPEVVLAAPAVDIVSTGLDHGYRKGNGTSDATAIIAGAAALVRSKFPDLSAAEVVHRLTATADDKGPPGRDDEYGYGVLNLVKALTADVPPLAATTVPATVAAPTPDGGNSVRSSATVYVLAGVVLLLIAAAGLAMAVRRRA
jgi:type VII secretion-associated serine protease mycosin